MTNITERINSHKQANVAYKITQATDKMYSLGLLNRNYASTDRFVDELQKHLKIAKRCDAAHITDCWPTDKVTISDGKTYDVKDAVTGAELKVYSNTTDNVGLILADGTPIILTYNHNSPGMNEGDTIVASTKTLPVGFGKSQEFAYTTNTTDAIDFVMDINGKKGPNSETTNGKMHDIRSFKAARFGLCDAKIPGVGCVISIGTSYKQLNTCSDKTWDPNGDDPYVCNRNSWAGAMKACTEIGMSLPTRNQLLSIYEKKGGYPEIPQTGYFWSSTTTSKLEADYVHFDDSYSQYCWKYYHWNVLCVGD